VSDTTRYVVHVLGKTTLELGREQNTEYDSEEMKENPPNKVQFDKLVRDISTKPRVTRFQIKWCAVSA
jgi:histone chaperone ASF1